MAKDVVIYSCMSKQPIVKANIIELIKSPYLSKILKSLNICDGCKEPVSIIIEGETEANIMAAFNQVTRQTGLIIIQGN